MKSFISNTSLLILLSLVLFACNEDSDSNSDFDRTEFLIYNADEKIIPAFESLVNDISDLETSIDIFITESNSQNLITLQNSWLKAHQSWQSASSYNFGPAGEAGIKKSLLEELATFPVNTEVLESKITNLDTTHLDFARDTRGLLAIEYLLFDPINPDSTILGKFNDANRKIYLKSLSQLINSQVRFVLDQWRNSYRQDFVNNKGTDAGSSTSQFYNAYVKSFENMKNFKLAIPLGLRAGQTQIEPQMAEAIYSQTSLKMLKLNYENFKEIWYGGFSLQQPAKGWRYYLEFVEGGNSLISATENQFAAIDNAFQEIDLEKPIAEQIQNSNAELVQLNTELQKLTRFIKGDLSSLIGVAITYDSGDGD